MNVIKHTVTVTTGASDGKGSGFTPVVNGRILNIIYTKASSGNYADTVDFVVTTEDTAITIWDQDNVTATATVAPRQATHSTAGLASLYAAEGAAVNDFIYVANERIKISVENAGNSKTGTFTVIVG